MVLIHRRPRAEALRSCWKTLLMPAICSILAPQPTGLCTTTTESLMEATIPRLRLSWQPWVWEKVRLVLNRQPPFLDWPDRSQQEPP
ncbi:hypothetical protein D3C76_1592790 [compost metagenome]